MKIVFFGTPECSVTVLKALLQSQHSVVAVITQPDKPRGRGRPLSFSPVKMAALQYGIPVLTPTRLKEPIWQKNFRTWKPDIGVVIAYGRILPQTVLGIPRHGMVNIHLSLLPKYRGASPVAAAIRHGEMETGVSIIHMTAELDAGPVLLQLSTKIGEAESAGALESRLTTIGCKAVLEALQHIETGKAEYNEQDARQSSYAPIQQKSDGQIDWTKDTKTLICFVRSMDPWPGAFSLLRDPDSNKEIRLNIYKLKAAATGSGKEPGQIAHIDKTILSVQCKNGTVDILELQAPGKKRMAVDAFLRGRRIAPGSYFK